MTLPAIGPTEGKVWGTTRLLFASHAVSVHLLEVVRGGYSSRHRHNSKWNRFVVVKGKVVVRLYRDGWDDAVDATVLEAGGITDVPPGLSHQFEALTDAVVIEVCWAELDQEDIDREVPGGRKREST